jgi:hypothetical protein
LATTFKGGKHMSEFFELKSYEEINWQKLVALLNEFSFEDQDVLELSQFV